MGQPRIFSIIDKVCFDYNLIEDGDRILVGASGGKDSTLLINYLSQRKKRPNSHFEFSCLHIHTEFASPFDKDLEQLFNSWNADLRFFEIDVQDRLKEGKKMSCYWCSTQRRKELREYAIKNGYNKIALGHHLDDVLETLLMNQMQKGVLSTMPPKLKFDKFPVTIIRPLYYADEKTIIDYANQNKWKRFTCTCNYQENSTRKEARKRIQLLTDGDYRLKTQMLQSIKKQNIITDYLP